MPEMGGLEATRKIRSSTSGVKNPQVPIIAMTAHVMQDDKTQCLEAGMNGFVSKPIDKKIMIAEIEKHISQKTDHPETGN
jgi:CheY-like chemotaxis protein